MIKKKNTGIVYLVGAGPGDPGLLTVRALELLQTCDVIAYDALISPSILSLVKQDQELISIGYRGYGSSKLDYGIHPIVIEKAKEGKSVLRLKSGDPWIFGRATQECEELVSNGIEYEVVPGITAATAAAAYAGFPLTQREDSSDVILTSGHDLFGSFQNNSDWESIAKSNGTLVIYMAGTKVKENCERLIQFGKSSETSAIYISQATRSSQRIISGNLGNLAEKVGTPTARVPAIIVVGQTTQYRNSYQWRENKELHNVSILLIRSRPGSSLLSKMLRENGAEILESPWVQAEVLDEKETINNTFHKINTYKYIVFSSSESVRFFLQEWTDRKFDLRKLSNLSFISLGQEVFEELKKSGILADIQLENSSLPEIQKLAPVFSQGKTLLLTNDKGRNDLKSYWKEAGLICDQLPVYNLKIKFPDFPPPGVDYVIVPDPSSAEILFENEWGKDYRETPILVTENYSLEILKKKGALKVHKAETENISEIYKLLISLQENPA
ncbi:uroporphyrinogen-III C-methyltransferase [Leptospira sarikeiensis]|uniref:uroporphyrinogen-III C-methyltransferase n=1 Tax=Leptospira sarikeiensis TaxID=2484943 RepID=A0A4V3JR34_9LEPT|nr:uroporphyrinogen-III C-methyltransferase [Leptospira sarikeiensis]TGL58423.1 uroporphyrinogen-III C-methyltransferase [Leptospira sarikeiensis]